MPKLDDYGMQLAEESLEKLEREYKRIYGQAAKEMREKQRKFLKEFEREKSQRLAALDDTEEAEKAYKAWLREQTMGKQWMNDMVDELSRKATEANEAAVATMLDKVPGVYAGNANYEAYAIEKSLKARTAFTLVDEDTVRNLVTGRGSRATVAGRLLPEVTFPKIDRPKDYRWNRQKFTSAVTQGILQGESIPNIVKRTDSIFGSNQAAAYRAARTAVGSAQNSGRYFSMLRAEDMGIIINKKWIATHDDRTRDSHVELDGTEVPVEEPFESEHGPIDYPNDPAADPAETFNCRCSIKEEVGGFEPLAESYERWLEIQGMDYQEWEEAVAGGKAARNVTAGQNQGLNNIRYNGIMNMEGNRPGYAAIDLSDAVEEIRGGKSNSLERWISNGKLSPERKAVHDSIIDDLLEGKTPTGERPKMTMLGGGPASGKSSVMNPDTKGNPHAVTIDPDDMKKRLPGFKEMAEIDTKAAAYYHEESSALAKRFSEAAYEMHIDAIYDGTGDGSVRSVEKKIAAARANGYQVEAKYVTIDTDEAIRRNRKRYDDAVARGETPRLPPEEMVRNTHAKVTDISVEMAPKFDHIEIWDNNGGFGEQVMIAVGGNGKWLKPVNGQEEKFKAYLRKGKRGLAGFERLPDGSYRPKG